MPQQDCGHIHNIVVTFTNDDSTTKSSLLHRNDIYVILVVYIHAFSLPNSIANILKKLRYIKNDLGFELECCKLCL